MNFATAQLNDDDIFLLGNIATYGVCAGYGEEAIKILRLIQMARPDNAGVLVLEAMYMHSIGKTRAAIEFLENGSALDARVNRDEAVAFYLYLLQQDKQLHRVESIARTYFEQGLISSPEAKRAIELILAEISDQLSPISQHRTAPEEGAFI
ncbi:hypothetical protein [Ochrobactrum sp. Marseille-Q0166]|uniref:hypothetical protein n=1 Tax=Ochrobactrum sp. Marseille-Q0166 TaxID=2761105 RepID=UPI0016562EDE|nr:hypothetical protein [Ochrobactrum sp. Marseille-Q0166]MBC8719589.1 hypothetical protein [Ochrobactrum sp. Marseille-Q0166]